MRPMRVAALLALALIPTSALADTVKTKDGVIHEGKVVRELERGYLFRDATGSTSVLPFEQIDDVAIAPAAKLVPQVAARVESTKALTLKLERLTVADERDGTSVFWPVAGMLSGMGICFIGGPMTPADADPNTYRAGALAVGLSAAAVSTVFLVLQISKKNRLGNRLDEIDREISLLP